MTPEDYSKGQILLTVASPRKNWGNGWFSSGTHFAAAIVPVAGIQCCSCKLVWHSSLLHLCFAGPVPCTGFLMEVNLTPSAKGGPYFLLELHLFSSYSHAQLLL